MTHSALPGNWQELMAGYALGDLSPEEAEALQQLLSTNPDLAQEVNQFQEVLALMPYALPQHEPPPQLRDAILAAVEQETIEDDNPRLSAHGNQRRSQRWSSHGWSIGGLVAAGIIAVLGGVLGVSYYNLNQQLQTLQRSFAQLQQESLQDKAFLALLRQPNAQVYTLNGTGTATSSSGLLVVAPRQQQIAIATQNLPPLPQDRIYRLWAMPRNSNVPQYCGQFTASNQPRVAHQMTQFEAADVLCSTAIVDQMLITNEKLEDPFEPKGELVLKSAKL